VLEIGDRNYSNKFGGTFVTKSDVLHVSEGNPEATLIGDLETGRNIPANVFDCMILTQTFSFIYDAKSAIRHCYQALKPGGILLATFPGISQISRYDMDRWGEFWRFTTLSADRLFGEIFQPENVEVKAYGNVLTAISFLEGLASEEIKKKDLDYQDPDYELLITVRAIKVNKE
jgi:hypothetical protein